ncbi:DNA-binding transcriptional regulator YhcF (GntR family) [Caldalkalibacillus uzonensis]|uniref:DNA-binding transcriptional regulator YhcF (GntR family) n=1 Tax=Caldalkalibacillus uzonensis TaxID=353224 RepID=A0ABU0CX30_9BACI|nr:GntR family transcriptional regulator [Caldalkalibacillus uzonensis]MDQ0340698.1 DNA-binding transcriptional regulator YhcF (GntR family) [Caldalkalibacillus uzonensis]
MKPTLDENKPIFVQIAENIEDEIIKGNFKEGEQVPSTNQFAAFYHINPATAAKGINRLVDEGILFKKRGIGMFVAEGARVKLIRKRKQEFFDEYVLPMLQEAKKLDIGVEELISMIKGESRTEQKGATEDDGQN